MPNTVTYHELISGLLKTGKEINRCGQAVTSDSQKFSSYRTRAWELVNVPRSKQELCSHGNYAARAQEMKEDDVLPNKPMVSNLLRSLRHAILLVDPCMIL